MKFLRSLIPMSLLLIGAAHAGSTVYKCKTNAGEVFQDTPCATTEQTVAAKDYYDPQPADAGIDQNGNAWHQNLQDPPQQVVPQRREVISEVATDETQTAGYTCNGGGKTWISKTPCVATTRVGHVGHFNGTDQYGNPVSGTTSRVDNEPVSQTAMSREELCQKLRDHPPTSDSKKKSNAESAYDRNKLRNENGC